jgi:hypothetical protein
MTKGITKEVDLSSLIKVEIQVGSIDGPAIDLWNVKFFHTKEEAIAFCTEYNGTGAKGYYDPIAVII